MFGGDHTKLLFAQITQTKSDPQKYRPTNQQLVPQFQQQSQSLQSYHNDMKSFLSKALRLSEMVRLTSERYTRLQRLINDRTLFVDTTAQITQLTMDIRTEFQGIQNILTGLTQEVQQSAYNNPMNGQQGGFFSAFTNNSGKLSHIQQIKNVILDEIQIKYTTLSKDFSQLLQDHAKTTLQASRKGQYDHDNTLLQTHQMHVNHYQSQQQQQQQPIAPMNNNDPFAKPTTLNSTNTNNSNQYNQPNNFNTNNTNRSQPSSNNYNPHASENSQQTTTKRGAFASSSRHSHRNHRKHLSYLEAELSENESDVESSATGGPNFESLVDQTLIQPKTQAYDNQNETYYTSRQQTMQHITEAIQDVASLHSRLTDMIHKQEETVIRIDTNIEETAWNVEAANEQIMEHYEFTSNNQWLLIKIFAILIIFAIFFITVLS